MRSISLLILPLVAAGCASLSVVRPDGFVETANELAIDHSFINISGTQLGRLRARREPPGQHRDAAR
jgi:hypothetical protein